MEPAGVPVTITTLPLRLVKSSSLIIISDMAFGIVVGELI